MLTTLFFFQIKKCVNVLILNHKIDKYIETYVFFENCGLKSVFSESKILN